MDPVTAFSLAGTILQFIDTGGKFVHLAYNLYRSSSDASDDVCDLLSLTETLDAMLPGLKVGQNTTGAVGGLSKLADECSTTAAQLLSILKKAQPVGINRKREALRAAFRLIYKKYEIKSLSNRLQAFRGQITLHILESIREVVSKPTEWQNEILRKIDALRDHATEMKDEILASAPLPQRGFGQHRLCVSQDDLVKLSGVSATILEYLTLRRSQVLDNSPESVTSLRRDLLKAIYDGQTDDVEHNTRPINIQLSEVQLKHFQSLFFQSLYYDNMVDREDHIAAAHGETFQWVFQDSPTNNENVFQPPRAVSWSNLKDWLESQDQLYWITGKAGSGKSTLIKYLCKPSPTSASNAGNSRQSSISRCQPYLRKWAATSKLMISSFYFWNSGVGLQMTQIGLFRTLLYQIVAQRPELIPIIAPSHWEAICLLDQPPTDWQQEDVHAMLFKAIEALTRDSKIAFFIDGLDEFHGLPGELVTLIHDLVNVGSSVKICVASRPWNEFEAAFKRAPSLRMEDLTLNDIVNFIQFKFKADKEFDILQRRYPSFAGQLINNIATKGSGVFLWVDLVVNSLLAGMSNGDRIEDLQQRLDELPPDLETLYEKILYSLDKRYLRHAAQYFDLIESAEEPLTVLQLSFADEESVDSAIEMAFGDPMSSEDTALRIEAAKRRLNSRCKGLLEVDRGLSSISTNNKCEPSRLTVQYLHRTVSDFIKSPKAQKFLGASKDPNFDAPMQLCIAYLMDIKHRASILKDFSTLLTAELGTLMNIIELFLRQAPGVSQADDHAIIALVEELKSSLSGQVSTGHKWTVKERNAVRFTRAERQPSTQRLCDWLEYVHRYVPDDDEAFTSVACVYGIISYVRYKSPADGLIKSFGSSCNYWSLLHDALAEDVPDLAMLEYLLELGADPNFQQEQQGFGDNLVRLQSPWCLAWTKLACLPPICDQELWESWGVALTMMAARMGNETKIPQFQGRRPHCYIQKIMREVSDAMDLRNVAPPGDETNPKNATPPGDKPNSTNEAPPKDIPVKRRSKRRQQTPRDAQKILRMANHIRKKTKLNSESSEAV